ncbi:hypothetical protein HK097_005701 [Rhizophlyctis rosea]|uniref:SH3 domain-containing protein n=1 Tax=Rhizophlyctis rosea TaxID=64517 RepID=A0AAD5S1G7_9FUNG|nr:hypothetical protein HK097_005701 [Rhizophlyctis rosea]
MKAPVALPASSGGVNPVTGMMPRSASLSRKIPDTVRQSVREGVREVVREMPREERFENREEIVAPRPPPPLPPVTTYVCVCPFVGEGITLELGDIVMVFKTLPDGRAYGTCPTKLQSGVFPMTCVVAAKAQLGAKTPPPPPSLSQYPPSMASSYSSQQQYFTSNNRPGPSQDPFIRQFEDLSISPTLPPGHTYGSEYGYRPAPGTGYAQPRQINKIQSHSDMSSSPSSGSCRGQGGGYGGDGYGRRQMEAAIPEVSPDSEGVLAGGQYHHHQQQQQQMGAGIVRTQSPFGQPKRYSLGLTPRSGTPGPGDSPPSQPQYSPHPPPQPQQDDNPGTVKELLDILAGQGSPPSSWNSNGSGSPRSAPIRVRTPGALGVSPVPAPLRPGGEDNGERTASPAIPTLPALARVGSPSTPSGPPPSMGLPPAPR